MTTLTERLSKLDATTAATKQKIKDAFKDVKPAIATLRAKEASSHDE